jgi:hypothetical protein
MHIRMDSEPTGGVDKQFAVHPIPDAWEMAHPSRQASQATAEACEMGKVTLNLPTKAKQRFAKRLLQEFNTAEPRKAMAMLP